MTMPDEQAENEIQVLFLLIIEFWLHFNVHLKHFWSLVDWVHERVLQAFKFN